LSDEEKTEARIKDMQRRKTEKIEEARILALEKAAADAEAAD
jgi:hypothetical protein